MTNRSQVSNKSTNTKYESTFDSMTRNNEKKNNFEKNFEKKKNPNPSIHYDSDESYDELDPMNDFLLSNDGLHTLLTMNNKNNKKKME